MKIIYALAISLCVFVHSAYARSSVDYEQLKASITQERLKLAEQYRQGDSLTKTQVLEQAHAYLLNALVSTLLPAWYGTPWNFNGTSRIPRKGTIACGYFVTHALVDVGFNIPRVAWAQQASERVIDKLCTGKVRFYSKPVEQLCRYLENQPDGIYLVGLDCHVGFIVSVEGNIRFVHSSYYRPQVGVMEEELKGNNPLNDSKYRVVGRLLNHTMLIHWLLGEPYS